SRLGFPAEPKVQISLPKADVVRTILNTVYLAPLPAFQPRGGSTTHLCLICLRINRIDPPSGQGRLELLQGKHLNFATGGILSANLRRIASKKVLCVDPMHRVVRRGPGEVERVPGHRWGIVAAAVTLGGNRRRVGEPGTIAQSFPRLIDKSTSTGAV